MAPSSNLEHHKLTRFFFTISVFITATSVLAVYTTIMTTHYGIKKDDIQARSITHLVKSQVRTTNVVIRNCYLPVMKTGPIPISKKCTLCKSVKLLNQFEIDDKAKDKHAAICKDCVTKQSHALENISEWLNAVD